MAQTVDVLKYILDLDTKKFVAGSKKADSQTKKLSRTIGSSLKNAIVGAVGAWSAYQALNIVKDLVLQGAAAERAARSWELLADSFGLNARQVLADLRGASMGTVADIDLMVQASRASIMGLPLEDLPRLIKISRAAAKAFGQSTAFMFESIVLGTARQSRLILDNLGIIINETDVYKAETERLGRALTDAEKKQAFFNEVLKQGQNIIDRVGGESLDTKDKIDQLSASWKNMTDEIGKMIDQTIIADGATTDYIDKSTNLLKEYNEVLANKTIPLWKRWGSIIIDFISGASPYDGIGPPLLNDIHRGKFIGPIKEVEKAVKSLVEVTDEMAKSLKDVKDLLVQIGAVNFDTLKAQMRDLFPIGQPQLIGAERGGGGGSVAVASMDTSVGPMEALGAALQGSSSALAIIIEKLNEFRTALINGVMAGLEEVLAKLKDWQRNIVEASAQILSGDIEGGIKTLITGGVERLTRSIVNHFTKTRREREKTEEVIAKHTEEVNRNIEAIEGLTLAEKARRRQAIEAEIARIQAEIINTDSEEIIRRLQLTTENWRRELEALNESLANDAMLAGIENMQDFVDYISSQEDLTLGEYQTYMSAFTRLLDLTNEEQIELWEQILQQLEDSGNATQMELIEVQNILQDLNDNVQEPTIIDMSGASGRIQNQTLRSTTIITESQANLLLGVLNAINLEVRKIVTRLDYILEELRTGLMGGGSVFYITVNSNSASGLAVAQALMTEVRARGNKVSV